MHAKAQILGRETADAYILKHVTQLTQRKLYCEAADVLSEHEVPAAEVHLPLYLQLALGLLALPASRRNSESEAALDKALQSLLSSLQVCT